MDIYYIGFIFICSFAHSVDSVIPPHILARARINRQYDQPSVLEVYLQRSLETFEPSGLKCCKLGEKTAKKRLPCHIHDPSRMQNMMHRINRSQTSARVLVGKAEKCGERYGRPFEKCCNHREHFYQDLQRCRINFSDREDRQKCRALVRQRYS